MTGNLPPPPWLSFMHIITTGNLPPFFLRKIMQSLFFYKSRNLPKIVSVGLSASVKRELLLHTWRYSVSHVGRIFVNYSFYINKVWKCYMLKLHQKCCGAANIELHGFCTAAPKWPVSTLEWPVVWPVSSLQFTAWHQNERWQKLTVIHSWLVNKGEGGNEEAIVHLCIALLWRWICRILIKYVTKKQLYKF